MPAFFSPPAEFVALLLLAASPCAIAAPLADVCVNNTIDPSLNLTWDACAFESQTDAELDAKMDAIASAVDISYYMLCGCLVFLMQLGFAMLEVGCVQEKNINNIILKGVLDICIAALAFWACGFAIAFGGGEEGSFIGGQEYWFGNCLDQRAGCEDAGMAYHEWFFQFAFAATASTIVSGAVAERCATSCYVIYAVFLIAFVYPVVVHWQWGSGLTYNKGAVDYAGSAVVHMTGGLAAIIGAAILGPRNGRFEGAIFKVKVHDMPAYSVVFQTLGTLILWFGWYGFNTGSTLGIVWSTMPDAVPNEAGLIILNTTLGPAAGGVTAMLLSALLSLIKDNHFTLKLAPVLNGILAGAVSITAGCGDIRPGTAVFMGVVGGFIYTGASALQQQLRIDDVVDAGPVHFWCGMWGTLGLGLLADDTGTGLTEGAGGGKLFAANLFLVVMVIAWVAPMMILTFGLLKVAGLARVSLEVEAQGLDVSKHGVVVKTTSTVEPKMVPVGPSRDAPEV